MTVADPNAEIELAATDKSDLAFLGHPKGLGYLAFAEGWERFSYYGMQTLLVLYMTQAAAAARPRRERRGLRPVPRLRSSTSTAPLSPAGAGLGDLRPLRGAGLSDADLSAASSPTGCSGARATITIGALPDGARPFPDGVRVSASCSRSLCLLLGVGCFKGNIATQVGELYAPDDLRRADAFQIFFLGINIAVIVAPLVCGTLGQKVAWHWGFGAAGVGMLIGARRLSLGPPLAAGRARRAARAAATGAGRARHWSTGDGARVSCSSCCCRCSSLSASSATSRSSTPTWSGATRNFNLSFFGCTMPVTWLVSVDAIVSIGDDLPARWSFWRWWAKRRTRARRDHQDRPSARSSPRSRR